MKRMLAVFAFSVGLLASYAASAQINGPSAPNPATPAPGATAAVAPDDKVATNTDNNPIICRYETVAGTRFAQRICHTQRQWKQRERDAYDMLDRLDSGKDQAIFQ